MGHGLLPVSSIIRKQESAGEAIRSLYDEELAEIGNRLENMEVTRSRLQDKAKKTEKMSPIETTTLDELASMSVEAFGNRKAGTSINICTGL